MNSGDPFGRHLVVRDIKFSFLFSSSDSSTRKPKMDDQEAFQIAVAEAKISYDEGGVPACTTQVSFEPHYQSG